MLEYQNRVIWAIVAFIYGIIFYFSTYKLLEINYVYYVILSLILGLAYLFNLKYISIFFISFLLGNFSSYNRVANLDWHPIEKSHVLDISATIDAIKNKKYGYQLLLSDIKSHLPYSIKKIQINYKDSNRDGRLKAGDIVHLRAKITPIHKPIIKGSYDPRWEAMFSGIEANGYNLSKALVIEHKKSFRRFFEDIRSNIYKLIISKLGKKIGNFAAAIIIGETSGIDKEINQNMRYAGLSHILCISGLHISLVAWIFFISARSILNIHGTIAYSIDTKKVGAIFAILGSLIYFLISGMKTAALRAFIMSSVFLVSIIVNQRPNALRSLFFAAAIILAIWPEQIFHPSFILSFSAVLSLIAFAGFDLKIYQLSRSYIQKIYKFLALNISSTLSATIATSPFVIYFFYTNANYSLLANLVAIPLTSFILMPAAIVCMMTSATDIDLPWIILGSAIKKIIAIAEYVSRIPGAISYIGSISDQSVFIYSIAFIGLAVGSRYIKTIACFLLLLFAYSALPEMPMMIIDNKTLEYAYNKGGTLYYSSPNFNDYKKRYINLWFGQKYILYSDNQNYIALNHQSHNIYICRAQQCRYDQNSTVIEIENKKIVIRNYKYNEFIYINKRGSDITLVYCSSDRCDIR